MRLSTTNTAAKETPQTARGSIDRHLEPSNSARHIYEQDTLKKNNYLDDGNGGGSIDDRK